MGDVLEKFLVDYLAWPMGERKGQGFHSDVLGGTGGSSWLDTPLGWIFQKSEQVGGWQQGCGGGKKPPTSLTERIFAFPVSRC